MKRKQFIEAHGATCRNWTWSWSFVNHADRFVICGAWDKNTEGDRARILADNWEKRKGRRSPGYSQFIEHIRLIEQEGYELKTFLMIYSIELREWMQKVQLRSPGSHLS